MTSRWPLKRCWPRSRGHRGDTVGLCDTGGTGDTVWPCRGGIRVVGVLPWRCPLASGLLTVLCSRTASRGRGGPRRWPSGGGLGLSRRHLAGRLLQASCEPRPKGFRVLVHYPDPAQRPQGQEGFQKVPAQPWTGLAAAFEPRKWPGAWSLLSLPPSPCVPPHPCLPFSVLGSRRSGSPEGRTGSHAPSTLSEAAHAGRERTSPLTPLGPTDQATEHEAGAGLGTPHVR